MIPYDQRGKPRSEAARRIHESKDGCNGRPHTRWYIGENKCDRLAALSGVPEGAASDPFDEWLGEAARSLGQAPVPSPQPLDVERLTRALDVSMVPRPGGTLIRDLAAAIAREYARLAAPQPVPEDET